MNGDVKKLPLYLHAAEKFMEMNPEPGFILPYEWLEIELELDYHLSTREQYQQLSLERFQQVTAFKERLMRVHHLHLATVPGVGYRVQAPSEVAGWEGANAALVLQQTTRKAARRLACVPQDQLSDDQRRTHADTLARLAQLRTLVRTPFTLPPVPRLGND